MDDEEFLDGLNKPVTPVSERRDGVRLKTQFRLSISAEKSGALNVSAAHVRDVSNSGVLVVSRLWLTPFQEVMLAIPTSESVESDGLPEAFVGPATVVRIQKSDETKNLVGLKFGQSIQRNTQFQDFISSLQADSLLH